VERNTGARCPILSTENTLTCTDGLGEHRAYGDPNTRNASLTGAPDKRSGRLRFRLSSLYQGGPARTAALSGARGVRPGGRSPHAAGLPGGGRHSTTGTHTEEEMPSPGGAGLRDGRSGHPPGRRNEWASGAVPTTSTRATRPRGRGQAWHESVSALARGCPRPRGLVGLGQVDGTAPRMAAEGRIKSSGTGQVLMSLAGGMALT
jgi:hypothetical protein